MSTCPLPGDFLPRGTVVQPCAHTPGSRKAHPKRLVICCDGTWNNSNALGGIHTNVGRLATVVAKKCCNGMPQVVYYHRGAGTEESVVASALGGLFGKGVVADIADVYRFVCENYVPNDELVFTGFSRGAFTARSVANMVCVIGLLNSFGLDNFGAIFKDYQWFSKWKPGADPIFDPKQHLLCFDVANSYRRDRMDLGAIMIPESMRKQIEEKVLERRYEWFDVLKKAHKKGLEEVAKEYRDCLFKFKMILCDSGLNGGWKAEEVEVKAVGVWDTVGSLGMPYNPFQRGRNENEIAFASQDVHKNIQHAFQALALDEWRIPFKPTLWNKDPTNDKTHLRQVWFPGSHSDVGGGLESQQIATISLAWMADQLGSVGVEFNPEEMLRIFKTVDLSVEARRWAMGRITAPNKVTGVFDLLVGQVIQGEVGDREPGLSKANGDPKGLPLKNTNELIHPSVRIRYLYQGKGPGDSDDWQCHALHENYYVLNKTTDIGEEWIRRPDLSYLSNHTTLSGQVSTIQGGTKITFDGPDAAHNVVAKQIPLEADLETSDDWIWELPYCRGRIFLQNEWQYDDQQISDTRLGTASGVTEDESKEPATVQRGKARWAWIRMPPNSAHENVRCEVGCPKGQKCPIILHEERIGMWERLFMRVSADAFAKQKPGQRNIVHQSLHQSPWKAVSYGLGIGQSVIEKTAGVAKTGLGILWGMPSVLWDRGLKFVDAFRPRVWGNPIEKQDVLRRLKKDHFISTGTYGCDDLVVWQHGDFRKWKPRSSLPSNGSPSQAD